MIIKYNPLRLSIIFIFVILFPLVQKQWLNLYLFNINNYSIYKILYYLSGLIIPTLVIIISLKQFTYYKFINHNSNVSNNISGKLLLSITFTISTLLSTLISYYIFTNLKIFLNSFLINNEYTTNFYIDKQILFIVIISTFLIFNKTKFLIKKIVLLNFLIISIITWYTQINNLFLIDVVPFYIYKFENINYINVTFLLTIDMVFYIWSYVSYGSYLSDWNLPKPYKNEVIPILNIVVFYLLVILYYSILFK